MFDDDVFLTEEIGMVEIGTRLYDWLGDNFAPFITEFQIENEPYPDYWAYFVNIPYLMDMMKFHWNQEVSSPKHDENEYRNYVWNFLQNLRYTRNFGYTILVRVTYENSNSRQS